MHLQITLYQSLRRTIFHIIRNKAGRKICLDICFHCQAEETKTKNKTKNAPGSIVGKNILCLK